MKLRFSIVLALSVVALSRAVLAGDYIMAPDGSYVSGNSNTSAPDGSYVSGYSSTMSPDGSYLSGYSNTMAPYGSSLGH